MAQLPLADIAQRLKNGKPVSDLEKVTFIRNTPQAMAAFMIDNNPGSVNFALRKMGYNHLGFEPNKVALQRQLEIFIANNNIEDFNEVIDRFEINPKPLTENFVKTFKTTFNK